ncbi:hypothetical protein AN957_18455 [Cytobacillus solani]|uniref:Uncharacterized protein n=1 Tax=Cytobacillus solani TaxID=1637975 RepID=A0A0Q3QQD1_9BACI|nr:hypothetical protein AMS60_13155 [Bacillus sp. FJAT-21945]KQL20369.1 hypothetical protein AN957_18455 [Cytobacillus solani]
MKQEDYFIVGKLRTRTYICGKTESGVKNLYKAFHFIFAYLLKRTSRMDVFFGSKPLVYCLNRDLYLETKLQPKRKR